jgi:hypothetical protein
MEVRSPATWVGLAFAAVLMMASDASSDSIDRYHPESAAEYMGNCVEQGTDRRVCACAVDQIVNDRGRLSTPSVDAAPPGWEASAQATGTGSERQLAMCMRSARALGLLDN